MTVDETLKYINFKKHTLTITQQVLYLDKNNASSS